MEQTEPPKPPLSQAEKYLAWREQREKQRKQDRVHELLRPHNDIQPLASQQPRYLTDTIASQARSPRQVAFKEKSLVVAETERSLTNKNGGAAASCHKPDDATRMRGRDAKGDRMKENRFEGGQFASGGSHFTSGGGQFTSRGRKERQPENNGHNINCSVDVTGKLQREVDMTIEQQLERRGRRVKTQDSENKRCAWRATLIGPP